MILAYNVRMYSFHLLIALSMVLGLGYSQCTGGLLNIPYAIASEVENSPTAPTALRYALADARATQGDTLMSIAPPIECSSAQSNASDDPTSHAGSGCRDGESCLEQVVQSGAKHLATEEIMGAGTQEILPVPMIAASATTGNIGADHKIRSSPLFERATLAARITVKRE